MDVNVIKKQKLHFITSLIVLIILSTLSLIFVWITSIKTTSEQALRTAQIAVATFPKDLINKLNIDSSDLEKKEYQHIKASLIELKNIDKTVRFYYVYVQKNSKIYFVADSESSDSKDYSPPGQEFTEVSSEELKPFRDELPYITKPTTDRWGTWVSALVPIKDFKTGKVNAVFAMDYPASSWNNKAILNTTQAGIVALILFGLLLAFNNISKNSIQVKESEKNYRTFFETIDDIVIIGDKQGKIFYTNKAVTRKLGYSSSELQNMKVLDLNPKSKRKEAEQIFGEMFAGIRNSCPLPLEKKDGSLIPAETRVWFGQWNGKDCIFGISKDLTKEQELLQRFNIIFDNNPSLMAISTLPDRTFTEVNKSFLSKIGYKKDEVIGKTSDDLQLFVDQKQQQAVADELKKSGHIHNVELKVKTKLGKILDGLFSGEILESQGKSYFLTVMTDQTESKKDKDEMEKKNRELESLNKIMVNRELKMVELKKDIERLSNS